MSRGRTLAVDYGTKNIGLACSDDLGIIARPLASIPNRGRRDYVQRLREVVEELQVEQVVVGMPLNMDGSSGESMRRVTRFLQAMRAELRLPFFDIDERLSTLEALDLWRAMGPRQRKKYRTVDSLAAALILDRFLKES
jgi:putative holliday junction resolvase